MGQSTAQTVKGIVVTVSSFLEPRQSRDHDHPALTLSQDSPDLDMNFPPSIVFSEGEASRSLPNIESFPDNFVDSRAGQSGLLGVLRDPVGQIPHPPAGALQHISLNITVRVKYHSFHSATTERTHLLSAERTLHLDPGSVHILVIVNEVFHSTPWLQHHIHGLLVQPTCHLQASKLLEF